MIVVGPGNERLNMLGLADPVGAVVQQANPSNVAGGARRRQPRQARRPADQRRPRARARMLEHSREGVLERTLADGPILPEAKPSFDDLAVALLPNLNVP